MCHCNLGQQNWGCVLCIYIYNGSTSGYTHCLQTLKSGFITYWKRPYYIMRCNRRVTNFQLNDLLAGQVPWFNGWTNVVFLYHMASQQNKLITDQIKYFHINVDIEVLWYLHHGELCYPEYSRISVPCRRRLASDWVDFWHSRKLQQICKEKPPALSVCGYGLVIWKLGQNEGVILIFCLKTVCK